MTAMHKGRQPTVRQLRVGEQIRHCLAAIVDRGDLRDPDLHGKTITVSEVRVSPDLRSATVFVMPLGGEDDPIVLAALDRAAPHLRSRVAGDLQLRVSPRLSFHRDATYDTASRIDTLLRSPEVARDLEKSPKPDGADG